MNSRYSTVKFLANERVNDHQGKDKYHAPAKMNQTIRGEEGASNDVPPVMAESK